MPPDPLVNEEDYASSEDSDFAPDDVPDHASSAESDDDEEAAAAGHDNGDRQMTAPAATKRKRNGAGDDGAEDAGFENSGDEAIIGKGMKKQHKRRRRDSHDDEDGGGAGGFVKTRRQRAEEKAERRAAAVRGPVTVDVDALWAQMTVAPASEKRQPTGLAEVAAAAAAAVAAAAAGGEEAGAGGGADGGDTPNEPSRPDDDGSGLVKIKRTYNFAGKVHTEEKMVARDSAEAKLYLTEQAAKEKDAKGPDEDDEDAPPERPPPRMAFRSIFEPPPPPAALAASASAGAGAAGLTRRADLDLGLRARLLARERSAQERQQAAKKLNTVEKSRMDWAGFVDKEGIQEELALAGKAKGSFAERQLFLARSEARREEEARRARLSGKA